MPESCHAPTLSDPANILQLPPRGSPYWNIVEYCRHIGIVKLPSGRCDWVARIRCKGGKYRQNRLGRVGWDHAEGLTYDQALVAAKDWFDRPEIIATAAQPYAVGVNAKLKYTKTNDRFTVGDAMHGFVEWKRIAAARTYFETTLSLINHHIIPRLGDL